MRRAPVGSPESLRKVEHRPAKFFESVDRDFCLFERASERVRHFSIQPEELTGEAEQDCLSLLNRNPPRSTPLSFRFKLDVSSQKDIRVRLAELCLTHSNYP